MVSRYGKITQGSVINNIRRGIYPDEKFYGLIVTARCDIANCKVPKFYYLLASPVDTWMRTEGIKLSAKQKYERGLAEVMELWKSKIPEYENLENKPIQQIIDEISKAKNVDNEQEDKFNIRVKNSLDKLEHLTKYSFDIVTKNLVNELLQDKSIRDSILSNLKLILQERHSHYCFVPYKCYESIINDNEKREENENCFEGIIFNLLDIDYIDYETAERIEKQKMDYRVLSPEELEKYNKIFFLENPLDIVYPENIIASPYLEMVMQRFSQAFIRIGTDIADSKEIIKYWKEKLNWE